MLDRQLAYWRRQLASLADLELPLDHPRPRRQTFRGALEFLRLSESLSRALNELSQRLEVTLFMVLLAAFKVLLYRYTGQEDIAVGTNVANRSCAEIEGLIGFFVNNLVLRTDLSGAPSFVEVVHRVAKTSLAAYEHQDLPFERVVEELRPERNPGRPPLCQILFVLQVAAQQELRLPGLSIAPFRTPRRSAAFDLLLNMREDEQSLSGTLEYNVDLFEPSTIQEMLRRFTKLLESVVADPWQRISSLALLESGEEAVLTNGFADDLCEMM